MREATKEEKESVIEYVESISSDTNINFYTVRQGGECVEMDFDIDLISRRALKHAILEHEKNYFSVGFEDVIALINDAPRCETRPQGCECMKEKDALISYVELSLKECDACVEKWRKRGLDNVAIQFEGMREAYSDILKILKGEKEITIWRD